MEQITKQLPEAVTMIANALRAGFAFQHGVDMVAEQMEPPIVGRVHAHDGRHERRRVGRGRADGLLRAHATPKR